jgi:hypothetical protein
MAYPKPCEVMYHIFTDNRDEYIEDKDKALELAKEWWKDYGCVRVYEQTEWDEEDGIFADGDCIYRKGAFPI